MSSGRDFTMVSTEVAIPFDISGCIWHVQVVNK